jgi:Peptidase M15
MKKITMDAFLMKRIKFEDLTPEMKADSQDLLEKVNALLLDFYKQYPEAGTRVVTSGYRTPAANAAAGGAKKSNHMICQAVDLSDADKQLGIWLTRFPEFLSKHDLYMESKSATPTWVHLQLQPPRSKRRIFLP